jgi:hypothetical protein
MQRNEIMCVVEVTNWVIQSVVKMVVIAVRHLLGASQHSRLKVLSYDYEELCHGM